jgi:hypothetical protein
LDCGSLGRKRTTAPKGKGEIRMNREETIKLLALIKVAYPAAYKDMDKETKLATVNMWQTTFPSVPYSIMEMAFNRFRLTSKFPPTVADMAEAIANVHYQALEGAMQSQTLGDKRNLGIYRGIMRITEPYKSGSYKDTLAVSLNSMIESGSIAGVLSDGQDA